MALLVSLRRQLEQLEIGAFDALVLGYDEVRVEEDNSRLIKHRNNRWYSEEGEEYATLDIIGPFMATGPNGEKLGPYSTLSMFDGVAYVDSRVFAFTDVQHGTWYMHDVGVHWKAIGLVFKATGP
jgi:hypothetical protein